MEAKESKEENTILTVSSALAILSVVAVVAVFVLYFAKSQNFDIVENLPMLLQVNFTRLLLLSFI